MPELPEVEYFRQLLLPLVGTHKLQIEITGSNSKRIQLSNEERKLIAESFCCTDVLRKGKKLCLVLSSRAERNRYLNLHMGMTGRNPCCAVAFPIVCMRLFRRHTAPLQWASSHRTHSSLVERLEVRWN